MKHLVNQILVEKISKEVHLAYPDFPKSKFKKMCRTLDELELKARVLLITSALKQTLPHEFSQSLGILVEVMERDRLQGFDLWPFSEYIGQFGLNHFHESLKAMIILTSKFTAEFAVRPFFLKDSSLVLKFFRDNTTHSNVHVRRWISEGSRPLLPWGERLPEFIKDPAPNLTLLEELKFDEELYVRKSVANHLNDISKHHPLLVIATVRRWINESPRQHKEKIQWIKHKALRTLIKKGHKDALKLMGVFGVANVTITPLTLNQKKFKLHDTLEFQFKITSNVKKKQKLVIDYLIDFVKANGTLSSKVYKLKVVELNPMETITLKKKHSLRPITTMTYYRGVHYLLIQVNGKTLEKCDWNFLV